MELQDYIRDEKLESEGVWFSIDSTTRIKVARAFTQKYGKVLRNEMKPYRYALDHGMLNEEKSSQIMAKVMAECVLMDWEGLTLNGEEVPYSTEKAYEILKDPQFRDFLRMVDEMSKDSAAFRESAMQEKAKNSVSTSDGS